MTTAKTSPYTPFPVKAPGRTCSCSVAYCREMAVHDLGSYRRITGFAVEVRFLCATHLEKTNVGKVKNFPKGCCQKCGEKKVEGRYCPVCDVKK